MLAPQHAVRLKLDRSVRVLPFKATAFRPIRRTRCITVKAAASDDPYKVLGIARGADFKRVTQAYNNRKRDAKGNEAQLADIEAAYNKLFMSSLTSRVEGKGVDKDARFADKPKYFPWRPRKFVAERNYILVVAALQAAMCAWGVLSPTSGQQPVIASSMVGAMANIYKQSMIFPVESGPGASEKSKKQGVNNLVRGFGLAVFATFAGCFLAYTLPDLIAATLKRVMPYWFYEYETKLLTLGTCVTQFIISSFYR